MRSAWGRWMLAAGLAAALPWAAAQDASADQLIAAGLGVLAQIDADRVDDVWEGAAPFVKARIPRAELGNSLRDARKSVGTIAQRTWASVSRVRYAQADGATPAGLYANIDFSTRLADGRTVFELVSLMQQPDGSWHLTGYIPRQRQ